MIGRLLRQKKKRGILVQAPPLLAVTSVPSKSPEVAAAPDRSALMFASYFATLMVLLMAFIVWRLTRPECVEKDSFDVLAYEVKTWLGFGPK